MKHTEDILLVVFVVAVVGTFLTLIYVKQVLEERKDIELTGGDCSFPGKKCSEGYCRVFDVINDSHGFSTYKGYCTKSRLVKQSEMVPPSGSKNSPCDEFSIPCKPSYVCCKENIKVHEDGSVDCRPPGNGEYGVCVCAKITVAGSCDESAYV